MGQNPEQEVRRAVPGLTTPPPTGDPHPSGSNSPPLRCPRPPQRPDLLLQVPDGAERGEPASGKGRQEAWGRGTPPRPSPLPTPESPPHAHAPPGPSTPDAGVECADLHFPLPGGTTARPSRTPTHSLAPNYPVTRCESPPVRSCAPATRHPAPGGPPAPAPANPRRGRPGTGQSGGAGGAEGQLHHPLTPAPPAGSSRPRTPEPAPSVPAPARRNLRRPHPHPPGPRLRTEGTGGGAAGAGPSKSGPGLGLVSRGPVVGHGHGHVRLASVMAWPSLVFGNWRHSPDLLRISKRGGIWEV